MDRRIYVYYRIAQADLDAVREKVLALQARLCADHAGLRAELLRRPEAAEGQLTLMEIYVCEQGIDAALQAAIEAAASYAGLAGPRHLEAFVSA
jgi:hypothetical protein